MDHQLRKRVPASPLGPRMCDSDGFLVCCVLSVSPHTQFLDANEQYLFICFHSDHLILSMTVRCWEVVLERSPRGLSSERLGCKWWRGQVSYQVVGVESPSRSAGEETEFAGGMLSSLSRA